MKHQRTIRTLMLILFSCLFLISAYMFFSCFAESRLNYPVMHTPSTCSYHTDNGRFVAVARKEALNGEIP